MTSEISGTPGNLPQLRVSDAEREAVVARLNNATSEGRLTLEEFSERASAALAARTQGDLDVLVTDLRQAEIAAPVVDIQVQVTLGSVKIRIPQGIAVDVDGASVLGSRTITDSAAVPGAPLLRLHIDTEVGSVKVYRR